MKFNRQLLIALTILTAIVLAACGAGADPTAEPVPTQPNVAASGQPALTRIDGRGSVTVTITPLNLDDPGETLDFDVVLDTHSVELDMDLSTLASLTTDTGLSVMPVAWTGSKGGHHVEGKLSFPAAADGVSVLKDVSTLNLIIRDVDIPERMFTWELGS